MRKAPVQTVSCNLFSLNIQLDVILLWWNSSGRIRHWQMHRAARTQSIRAQAISTQSISRGNQSIGSHTRRCSVDDQTAANQNRKSFIPQTTSTGNASTAVRAQAISTQSISRDSKSIGSHTRRCSVDDQSAANQNKNHSYHWHVTDYHNTII